jgi:hypothetical protein
MADRSCTERHGLRTCPVNSYNNFTRAERMRALRWLNGEYAAGRSIPGPLRFVRRAETR